MSNKKLFTGWTKAKCIAICPTAAEIQSIYGLTEPVGEPNYYKDDNLRFDFIIKSFESNDFISKSTIWVKNKEARMKNGTPLFVNMVGKLSYDEAEKRFPLYEGEIKLLDFLKRIKNSKAGFKKSDETISIRTTEEGIDFDNLLINIKNNYDTYLNIFDVWVRLYVKEMPDGKCYQQIYNNIGYTWVKKEGLTQSETYFLEQESWLKKDGETLHVGNVEYAEYLCSIEQEAEEKSSNAPNTDINDDDELPF